MSKRLIVLFFVLSFLTFSCIKKIPISSPFSTEQSRIKKIISEQGKSVVFVGMYDKNGALLSFGSGFFISKDGIIATNYHVIEKGYGAVIKTLDGKIYQDAYLLSYDEDKDIALLKIDEKNAPPVEVGDSDSIEQGDKALTIGNPEGLQNTVSEGLISGIREYEGIKIIQFSSPISKGSSGGPLFNLDGEVVGITTLMSKVGQNLNFAIPINYVLHLQQHQDKLLLKEKYYKEQEKLLAEYVEKQKGSSKLEPEDALFKEAYEFYAKAKQAAKYPASFDDYGTEELKSIELLEQAIAANPYYHAGNYILGLCFKEIGDYERAEEFLLKSIKLKPQHQEAYTKLATTYKDQHKLDEALNYYNQSLKIGPANGLILSNIGEIYINKGDLDKAEAFYLQILNLENKVFYFDNVAYFYLKKGNLKESWKYLKDSFVLPFGVELKKRIEPYNKYLSANNFYACASVGFICYAYDDYAKAIKYWEKAKKINRKEFDQYYKLGSAYREVSKFEKYILNLEKALSRNPNHFSANVELGAIYGGYFETPKDSKVKTDYNKALKLLKTAKKINPKKQEPYNYLSWVYWKMGKNYDALSETRKALDIEEDAILYSRMGLIYTQLNDFQMALRNFRKSLDVEEREAVREVMVQTFIKLKEYEKAIDFLNLSMEVYPDNTLFQALLGDVYFEQGNYSIAIEKHRDFLKLKPNSSHAHFNIALSYLRLKDWDQSEYWWKKMIEIDSEDSRTWYNLGLVYLNKSNLLKANNCFQKGLDLDPNFQEAKEMLKFSQAEVEREQFPDKLRKLSFRNDDIGKLSSILLCTFDYTKGNNLWLKGNQETEYKDGQNIVSPKIFEAQGHFEKIKSDLEKIGPTKGKIKKILDLFLFAAEQRIKGINQHSDGFYSKRKDYMGQYEKGRAKIKLADKYYADCLKLLNEEILDNKLIFGEIANQTIKSSIEYYEKN